MKSNEVCNFKPLFAPAFDVSISLVVLVKQIYSDAKDIQSMAKSASSQITLTLDPHSWTDAVVKFGMSHYKGHMITPTPSS